MAVLTGYHHKINMSNLDLSGISLSNLDPTSISSTKLVFNDDGTTYTLTGTGFSYNPITGAVSGTLTGLDVVDDGSHIFNITGLNVPAADILKDAESGKATALESEAFAGKDTLNGSTKADVLLGYDGNDHLSGGAGDDTLKGGDGKDTLKGGTGSDTLVGGAGADILTGGSGHDTFVYNHASDSTGPNYDTITDYNTNSDEIQLWFKVKGTGTALDSGELRSAHFNHDLEHAIGSKLLGAHHMVAFTPTSGDLKGETFLIVDANGKAGYQAGEDLVIRVEGSNPVEHLAPTDLHIFG